MGEVDTARPLAETGAAADARAPRRFGQLRLALLYPPFGHKLFNENLAVVDHEFGRFPYLGFGYVAAVARQLDCEARLFEIPAAASGEDIAQSVQAYDPDLLCFPAHAVQTFADVVPWIRRLKAATGLPTLVGGYAARRFPAEVMSHACIDYLCSGEAQTFLGPFLRALAANKGFRKVPDLWFRERGTISHTAPSDGIPFWQLVAPDRTIFDNRRYFSHVSQRKNFTIAVSSVGCPHPCTFCPVRKTPFSCRTPLQVVDEVRTCVERHDIHEIDFFDPVMFLNRRRIMYIASALQAARLDCIWSARTRVDTLTNPRASTKPDEELIENLARAGCRRLFIGIESGDEEILRKVDKHVRLAAVRGVLACLNAHGIRPLGFFMVGNPGETARTIRQTIDFACSLPLDYAQFSMTIMKPESELEARYMHATMGRDYWRDYLRGLVDEQPLPNPWTGLTRAEIEHWTRYAYWRFYSRPRYVRRMLSQVRSLAELRRYLSVAGKMFLRGVARP